MNHFIKMTSNQTHSSCYYFHLWFLPSSSSTQYELVSHLGRHLRGRFCRDPQTLHVGICSDKRSGHALSFIDSSRIGGKSHSDMKPARLLVVFDVRQSLTDILDCCHLSCRLTRALPPYPYQHCLRLPMPLNTGSQSNPPTST